MSNAKKEICQYFRNMCFDDGMALLEKNRHLLSKSDQFECMGDFHFYKKDFQLAVNQYEESIKLSPEVFISRYQYLVGVEEERANNFTKAFERYQNSIEIDPNFIDAYVELGCLLVKVEDFSGAAQCFRDALKIDGCDIRNHENLVTVLERLNNLNPSRYQEELNSARNALASFTR